MGNRWSGKAQFQALRAELGRAEGRAFERATLPFFALFARDAQMSQRQGSMDRAGVDIYGGHSESSGCWDLLVQCKGFGVLDQEFGRDQVAQCERSIDAFRLKADRLKARLYVLAINRDRWGRAFEGRITELLRGLEESGQVESAELWGVGRLLGRSFDIMYQRLKGALPTLTTHVQRSYSEKIASPGIRVTDVPFRIGGFRFNQLEVVEPTYQPNTFGDPLPVLGETPALGRTRITFVLGEFGLGKTSLALRYADTARRPALFFPATLIPAHVTGAKDALSRAFIGSAFLDREPPEFAETYRRLIQPAAEKLLMDEKTPITLVIDGLDESPLLARAGGGATLFDIISVPRVPVVVTMRTEFWESRRLDIARSFGGRAPPKQRGPRNQEVEIVELLAWDDAQIGGLIDAVIGQGAEGGERVNLEHLASLVESGEYQAYYGDIPRRPLFLTMLIDHVRSRGVCRTGRATLLLRWAEAKILRDVQSGRIGITGSPEAPDATTEIAIVAMGLAAVAMTSIEEGRLLIMPDCPLEPLLSEDPRIARLTDPAGLFLNSLLLPLPRQSKLQPRRIRFAHRAFQEFFLAANIARNSAAFRSTSLPAEIGAWIAAIEEEKLLG